MLFKIGFAKFLVSGFYEEDLLFDEFLSGGHFFLESVQVASDPAGHGWEKCQH